MYYTPLRLHQIYPNRSPECTNVIPLLTHSFICLGPVPGWLSCRRRSLTLLIYDCSCPSLYPQSFPFWEYKMINRDPDTSSYCFFTYCIMQYSIVSWETTIKMVLPLYTLTYTSRNCPKKIQQDLATMVIIKNVFIF